MNGSPPPPGSADYDVQRVVLLELMIAPPAEGDRLAELAERLALPAAGVAAAVAALGRLGLAERRGDLVRASPAARAVEALLEVRL